MRLNFLVSLVVLMVVLTLTTDVFAAAIGVGDQTVGMGTGAAYVIASLSFLANLVPRAPKSKILRFFSAIIHWGALNLRLR
jgi:hypothetical protein